MSRYKITAYASFTLTFELDVDEALDPDQRVKFIRDEAKKAAKNLCRKRWPEGLKVKFDHISPCIDTRREP